MQAEYAGLKQAVETAGFFTTFMPIRGVGDRIVCASRQYTTGPRSGSLGGKSFWVAKRGCDWFIATWAPVIYRIREVERLSELCIRLLGNDDGRGAYCRFDDCVAAEFGLVEIADEEFPDSKDVRPASRSSSAVPSRSLARSIRVDQCGAVANPPGEHEVRAVRVSIGL